MVNSPAVATFPDDLKYSVDIHARRRETST